MEAILCLALYCVVSAAVAGLAVHFWHERQKDKTAKTKRNPQPIVLVAPATELPEGNYVPFYRYGVVQNETTKECFLLEAYELPSHKLRVTKHVGKHTVTAVEETPELDTGLSLADGQEVRCG